MLCDDLQGWDVMVEGKSRSKGIYVYRELIHCIVQQKLTGHCKAIIRQIKKRSVRQE